MESYWVKRDQAHNGQKRTESLKTIQADAIKPGPSEAASFQCVRKKSEITRPGRVSKEQSWVRPSDPAHPAQLIFK